VRMGLRVRRLPRHAGPVAGVVGGIADEGEGLVAVERGVGIDRGEIDLVLAVGEVGDLIELGPGPGSVMVLKETLGVRVVWALRGASIDVGMIGTCL
jgi:hypothetical protein